MNEETISGTHSTFSTSQIVQSSYAVVRKEIEITYSQLASCS